MLHTVAETDSYLSKASRIMSELEREAVVMMLSRNPTVGDVIQGTGGLRKVRVPLQGRGKRGGGRVIYWYYNEGYLVMLMWAFAKNEKSDLTPAQYKLLASAASQHLEQYWSV
jgi:hypothetical protein